MVYVQWKNGGAHLYNAEKTFGNILYIDPQNPKAKAAAYLPRGKDGYFMIVRVDDKQITSDVNVLSAAMEATK